MCLTLFKLFSLLVQRSIEIYIGSYIICCQTQVSKNIARQMRIVNFDFIIDAESYAHYYARSIFRNIINLRLFRVDCFINKLFNRLDDYRILFCDRSACSCDKEFYECLKGSGTWNMAAQSIGRTYFNILSPQCFNCSCPTDCE